MCLDDFDFELPRRLIAAHPCEPRDAARLLVIPASGGLRDRRMSDLPALLRPGDLLVFNDTKVIPARLVGRRTAATPADQKSAGPAALPRPGSRAAERRRAARTGGPRSAGAAAQNRNRRDTSAETNPDRRSKRDCWHQAAIISIFLKLKGLQPIDGPMLPLADTIGVAVGNEQTLETAAR